MKISTLSLVLSAVLIAPSASASNQPLQNIPTLPIVSGDGASSLNYDTLYTESNWQRIELPGEVISQLGNLRALQLEVKNLPANVKIKLSTKSGPLNTIGLEVSRTSKAIRVHQPGLFVLTNPATGRSFSFQLMVTGAGQ